MISWRSFTTSKLLPTFVGESGYSITFSRSFNGSGDNSGLGSFSYRNELTKNRTLTSFTYEANVQFGAIIGGLSSLTSVSKNTTWVLGNELGTSGTQERAPISYVQPLLTIYQETSDTETFESYYRTTSVISAYTNDAEETEPITTNVWTTVTVENVTPPQTTFQQVSIQTTKIDTGVATRIGKSTIVTVLSDPIEFVTYSATDGDVAIIEHTICELNSNFLAVTANSPNAKIPLTGLSYEKSRFTCSFNDFYEKELTFLKNRSEETSTTTQTTVFENSVSTTQIKQVTITWKVWGPKYETKIGCEPNRELSRITAQSAEFFAFDTKVEETLGGTKTASESFLGRATTTAVTNRFGYAGIQVDGISTVTTGEILQRIKTYTQTNTFSLETTTFTNSGEILKSSLFDSPGFVNTSCFPWKKYGNDAKNLVRLPNNSTSLLTTTTINGIFKTTVSEIFSHSVVMNFPQGVETSAVTVEEVVTGKFYQRVAGIYTTKNYIIAVSADPYVGGITNQNLPFETQNTHSSVFAFMEHNAQHTWNQMDEGFMFPFVVGAIPLNPTFSGLISQDAEGWQLCDSSNFTTVTGYREGQRFSTNLIWQTLENGKTIKSTSSGTFTINPVFSSPIQFQSENALFPFGGFRTPNASRTILISPGAVLITTYDKAGSGTLSTSYSTGTTFTNGIVGPVPITISSFIPLVQGNGVYPQSLLDNGLP